MMESHCTWNAYHGMKLNYGKCVYTTHGTGRQQNEDITVVAQGGNHRIKLHGGNGVVRYLGVYASADPSGAEEVAHVRNKVERALWVVQHMNLPIYQIRYVVNTVIKGILTYPMHVMMLPDTFLNEACGCGGG